MDLTEKVVQYTEDAHAMEQNVLRMLDSMIRTTSDPQIKTEFEQHRTETQQHEQRLRRRLDELGWGPSALKQAGAVAAAMTRGILNQMRGDKPGRNARDGYVTEHVEIAAYELLERVARRAGDYKTAELARTNCLEERAMARKIEGNWDRFVELTLSEEGVPA